MTKTLLLLITAILLSYSNFTLEAQEIYSKAYGDKSDPAILFLHGGPGYNSVSFELSTAQLLADKGFYVIVFDQRGGGRSKEVKDSKYTLEEAYLDINNILKKHSVKKTSIMGHSWGGTLGLHYAMKFPDKVEKFIMVDSPLSYQESFKVIIRRCKEKYTAEKSPNLRYINMLEVMDTTTQDYSSYCFGNAIKAGLYQTKNPTPEAMKIYQEIMKMPDTKFISDMTQEPYTGFFTNEKYTMMDLTSMIEKLAEKNKIYGIYGAEDGLFDEAQYSKFEELMGEDNFSVVENASHSVFIDQREKFLDLVVWYMSN